MNDERSEPGLVPVHPNVYVMVNAALIIYNMQRKHAEKEDASKLESELQGVEFLVMFRLFVASYYGLMSSTVLRSWGVKNDRVILDVLRFTLTKEEFNEAVSGPLLDDDQYSGEIVLKQVTMLESEIYEWVTQQIEVERWLK